MRAAPIAATMDVVREEFFTRSEWLGVDFADLGVPLDPTRPAQGDFYGALYAELRRRHSRVEQFPALWRATKRDTAACLADLVQPSERVLSFGAGIGYVERMLIEDHGFEDVHLWDVAPLVSDFLPGLRQRYLPGSRWPEPSDGRPFDVICLVQVLYALDRGRAVETVTRLGALLAPDGRLIVLEGSADPHENGSPTPPPAQPSTGDTPRATDAPQGWGWSRDNACLQALCAAGGFPVSRSFPAAGQSVTIACRTVQPVTPEHWIGT